MSASAIETVAAFFEEPFGVGTMLAADLEFIPLDGEVAFGPDGFARVLDEFAEQFANYDVWPEELVPVDDETVIALLVRSGTTHRGDMPITDRFAQVFTVNDGWITRIHSYRTADEARQAIA
jgi:ketosteroid isomerase-like protein